VAERIISCFDVTLRHRKKEVKLCGLARELNEKNL
jgi:hypothetical protein